MKRRSFLKKAAGSSVLYPYIFVNGCSARKDYDLLLKGGTVYDGLGNPGVTTDIAVRGDRIVHISPGIEEKKANTVVEADGLVVAPGFIDPHTHTDIQLLVNPKAESKIRQGVTTEIAGNCGGSQFPLSDESIDKKRDYIKQEYDLELTWRDVNGFFSRLEKEGHAVNYATFLGQGSLRLAVMGPNDRPPSDEELQRMKQLVGENMKAGVLGLSTGLIYTPGCFAKMDEIIELCRIVADNKGVYTTHIRGEGDAVLDAVDEALDIARQSGVSIQISHLKAMYPRNWSKIDTVLSKIEMARNDGIEVLADRYPYSASSTGMASIFPLWAREGTSDDFLARLKDKSNDAKLRAHVKERETLSGSWKNLLVSGVYTDKNRHIEGKTILDAAVEAQKSPYDFMRDLIIEEENHVSIVNFAMNEDNLKRVLAHPLVTVGSDGNSIAPYGPLSKGKPHPRSYGTFPKVLGKYVREEKVLTLPDAIRKMTSMVADKFGLTGRGRLAEGSFADIVVFDPDTVVDGATFQEPHTYPVGIDYVFVNGRPVINRGEHTGELPGRILKHRC